MRFRGVQRAVKPQRFERSAGDAPNLGRVARVPGTGLPKGKRRRRRRSESGSGDRERRKRKVVMVTWSVVLGLVALGLLGTAVTLWVRQNMHKALAVPGEGSGEALVVERVESRFKSPSEDEALDLVKRGLAVRDPAGVAACFRPGAASPETIIGFLASMEERDGSLRETTWLGSMDANGMLFDGVLIVTESAGQMKNRLAFLTPDEEGVWKIDFNAFARTVEPSFEDLLEKGATGGLIRVIVAADTYYNGPFADDSKWVCYGMVSPDTEVMMLGYCRKGSPQMAAMARILSRENLSMGAKAGPQRATLEVRRVAGAETRQFEITRVIAEDWVVSDTAFDSGFE